MSDPIRIYYFSTQFNRWLFFPCSQFKFFASIRCIASDVPRCSKGDSECMIKSANIVLQTYGKSMALFIVYFFEIQCDCIANFILKRYSKNIDGCVMLLKVVTEVLICCHWIRYQYHAFISNKAKRVPWASYWLTQTTLSAD